MTRLVDRPSRPSTATLLGAFVRRTGKLAVPAAIAVAASTAAPSAEAVDRTWIGGNADWDGTNANWTGNDEPDSNDRAIFNTPNNVDLAINNTIEGLVMSGGIDLNVLDNFLDVNGDITLSGGGTVLGVSGFGTGGPATGLEAYNITINSSGDLLAGGNRIQFADPGGIGVLTNNTGGIVGGFGEIRNGDGLGSVTTVFVNNGRIQPSTYNPQGNPVLFNFGGTLQFTAADTDARINLDGSGSENGEVFIGRNETVDINVRLSDAFSGTLDMDENSVLDIANSWSFNGTFNIDNDGAGTIFSPAGTAFIRGGTFSHAGGTTTIQNVGSTLQFDSVFNGNGGTLTNTANGTVVFNNTATINNGFELDLGTNAQVIIDGDSVVTVNDDDFDMDGGGASDWTIRNGSVLNIRGDNFDGGAATQIFGGTLIFQDDDNNASTGGDQIFDFDLTAANEDIELRTVRVESGVGRIRSTAGDNVTMGGQVTIDSGASLVLDAQSTVFSGGGTVAGANGSLFFDEVVGFNDDTTVTVNFLDIDNGNGSLAVNPGATLDLNATSIERVSSAIVVNGGTIDVSTTAYDIGTGGVVNLSGTNPVYSGAGTVSFESGSELNNFVAGPATLNTDAVFEEGSDIINRIATSTLNLTSSGQTVTLAGGDISQTAAGSRINTQGGGTLRVTGDSSVNVSTFDFDQGSTIITTGGTLDLDVGGIETGTDQYDSTLRFQGGTLEMNITAGNNTWTMDGNVIGEGGGNIIGDRMLVGNDNTGDTNGVLDINTGTLNIQAPATVNSDATISIASGSTLIFSNSSTIFTPDNGATDASITGNGTLRIIGAQFDETTLIDMPNGTVGLDGFLSANGGIPILNTPGDIDINSATLTINAGTFDPFGVSGFAIPPSSPPRSDLNISDTSRLIVNTTGGTPWQVNSSGIINYNGNTSLSIFLQGSTLDLDGTLNVNGDGQTSAAIAIGGTVNINTAGERFLLAAPTNTIDGGTVNGPGILAANSGDDLIGNGTINANVDFNASGFIQAQDGLLDLNGTVIDVGTLRTSGSAAVFDLANPMTTSVTDTGLILDGGRFQGARITLVAGDQILGTGRVLNQVINEGTLRATSGNLTFESFSNDYDGTSNTGGLQATAGTLVLRDNVSQTYQGTASVNNGGTLSAEGFALNMGTSSTLNFSAGTGSYSGTNATLFSGTINVSNGVDATIGLGGSQATVTNTADGTIDGQLIFNTTSRINNGASFTGSGAIVNFLNEQMTLEAGIDLGITLSNDGSLDLGTGTQSVTATVANYDGNGTLNIDIDGLGLNQSDTLVVDSILSLQEAGDELDLSFNGFGPSLGNLFTIATASSVLGQFDSVSVSGLAPSLDVDVLYNASSIVVEIIAAATGIPGDFDDSGQVEQGDLNLVLTNWGGPRPFDPNGAPFVTNIVDQEELNRVLTNWGSTSAPSFAGFSVPEPGAAAVAIGLAGLALRRRRVA